ncbi:right-handed parallel beta-helix repeat-containing protein [Halohasta litorea]|uniref:Right-handed parallel beta-helix repeat-containing protein n=1 Tax=Halohasta litorea TaxID=869891 RepID=A0ABD6DD11_9EURY|nr:right-handed parallel beta-helix repeat-containing protein [Halohasta litorea]
MVSDQMGDSPETSPGRSRRSYLSLVGGLVAAGGLSTSAAARTPAETVDLADQGLTTGELIDPYLTEFFVDGATVEIPAGSYKWDGEGFEGATENAAVIGQGDVNLELTGDSFRNNIRAEAGTIELRNFTVHGIVSEKSHFRLETAEGATIIADGLDFPDGAVDESECRPFYVPREHAGTVDIRNCSFSSFSDNGIYASSPGYDDGAGGRVLIENCVAHNINIAAIRVGSSGSVVRNCLIVNDGPAPKSETEQRNMRGIRVRNPGDDIRIEDCEIIMRHDETGAPIQIHEEAEGGSGTISNVTISNDTDSEAINEGDDAAADWEVSDVEIRGSGDLSYPESFESVCTGESCEPPTTDVDRRTREILSSDITPSIR